MLRRIAALLFLLVLPCANAATGPATPLSDAYTQMLNEFASRTIPTTERYRRLLSHYAHAQTTLADPLGASTEDLQAAFSMSEAMLTAAQGYSQANARAYAVDMEALFKELERRTKATIEQRNSMIGAYLSAWDFQSAKSMTTAETHLKVNNIGALNQVGEIRSSAPAMVSFLPDGSAELSPYQFPKGPVLVVSAGCHIARRAADAIAADSSLTAAFKDLNVVWLSPASSMLDPVAIAEWNSRFPDAHMRVAFDNSKWTDVNFARLPSFHIFVNGKLVTVVNGWSDDKPAVEKLWQAFKAVGIERRSSN